jgi:hypothetical protein
MWQGRFDMRAKIVSIDLRRNHAASHRPNGAVAVSERVDTRGEVLHLLRSILVVVAGTAAVGWLLS